MTAKMIKDPLYGFIDFEGRELELLELLKDPFYQRLRRVKQLGFSDHVFPSATHTRFAHSIGVFSVAKKMLGRVHPDVTNGAWDNEGLVCLAAALLHDVGHGMFSHVFEEAVKNHLRQKYNKGDDAMKHDPLFAAVNHELISQRIIKHGSISEVLNRIYNGMSDDVADILDEKGKRKKSIYRSIVSSKLDADRLDYVRRDPYFAGVSSGGIDLDWIIRNINVEYDGNGDQFFAIESKAYASVEQFLVTLFQLYPTIYLHKKTRSIQRMFGLLIGLVFSKIEEGQSDKVGLDEYHPFVILLKDPSNVENLLRLDDSLFWYSIGLFKNAEDEHIRRLVDMIYERDIFKVIDVWKIVDGLVSEDTSLSPTASDRLAMVKKVCDAVHQELEKLPEFADGRCWYDVDQRTLYKPTNKIGGSSQLINIKIGNQIHDISQVSPIIAAGAEFHVHRVYVDHSRYSDLGQLQSIIEASAKAEIKAFR
ncbi:HD domain-containing protein [Agrobacterium tumefaciens]|uniref:HD domain-containing protein n=1 Tax=Agrobacterium tumefaciens TaxID=358 RepID=UPI0021CF9559|nr:HD domain-containing protein [Agrobacterium tumefaciens]UXS26475.1 HD domain-containing protein [Agrobacterium tumefaciens]UXS55027.1 HD domain-containing protein [Agrobacterium tumefaciens]UXS65001.1 HD domain-containing protein [Agrobacterium tumefaciens]